MTSLKDIQSLIADIDSILLKADARLPWSKPGEVAKERLVLERVRSYLISQYQNLMAASNELAVSAPPVQQEVVSQLVQAVSQEMSAVRANLILSLQADVEALYQQRESLVKEIQQLEQNRQQIVSGRQPGTLEQQMLSEFSQRLINRCTESLTQHLYQILANFPTGAVHTDAIPNAIAQSTPSSEPFTLPSSNQGQFGEMISPQETSEQLRKLQEHSDRMLLTLEANQRAIWDALQRDLQAYQESLSQGLAQMHSLGMEGELLFTSLIHRLRQQVQQETPIVSSSLQLSDSLIQSTQAEASPTAPEPWLLSDALTSTPENPLLPQLSFSQQPQSLASPLSEPHSAQEDATHPIFTDESEAIPNDETSSSSTANPTPVEETNTTPPSPSEASQVAFEDSFLANLNSDDWEVVEGLDSEELNFDLDNDEDVDTFIQLNIDDPSLPPSREQTNPSSLSDTDDTDFLLNWLNQRQIETSQIDTNTQEDTATELGSSPSTAAPGWNIDQRRQDIDDLYQSLFGSDSLIDTQNQESDSSVEVEPDASEPTQAEKMVSGSEDNPLTRKDDLTPLSPQLESILFEGLTEPAPLSSQTTPSVETTGALPESWEALFFEEPVPQSPSSTDVAEQARSRIDSTQQQGEIESIAALTDLFEEMGLSALPPTTDGNSMPASTEQTVESQPSDPYSEANLEDSYIPASPEEDLLSTTSWESESEREIRLNQNIFQQLRQDLTHFELYKHQNTPSQEGQDLGSSESSGFPNAPYTYPLNPPNPQVPMPSQESLAEDWEEFVLNELREQQDWIDHSNSLTSKPVESDFDPDLFPQEALELDHEHALNASASASGEFPISGEAIEEIDAPEYFAYEGEHLETIQWDESAENTTDEVIASWDATTPFSSSELEFDSDLFTEEVLNSEAESEASDTQPEELEAQQLDDASSQDNVPTQDNALAPQDTTLPPPSPENVSDTLPQARQNLEQPNDPNTPSPDSSSDD